MPKVAGLVEDDLNQNSDLNPYLFTASDHVFNL